MAKEMIISVNGREKKIAIIENGRVSEFYIERGEENSGIVGNIYKGRVQRVLPGMQSAFVNIGLERDGFLYVSDFFDEEEEIERIVMEKSKKSTPEEATREATDRIERARLEREKQMEAAQDIAEPMAAETNAGVFDAGRMETTSTLPFEDDNGDDEEFSGFVKISDESNAENDGEITTATVEEERSKGGGRRERSRRGGKSRDTRGGDESRATSAQQYQQSASGGENTASDKDEKSSKTKGIERATIFEIEDSGFERIVDEDEETTGDMFKDAYVQEAIIDKVRAVEFDMESASTAEVGSLFDSAIGSAPSSFERIADEDDDAISSPATQKTETQAAKGKRNRRGSGKNKNSAANAKTETSAGKGETSSASKISEPQSKSSETMTDKNNKIGEQDEVKSKKSEAKTPEETAAKVESDRKKAEAKSRKKDRGGKKTVKKETTTGDGASENAQASVREIGDIAEMAVRRGGRGRRRTPGSENRPSGQIVKSDDAAEGVERENGDAESRTNGESGSDGGNNSSTRATGGNYNNSGNGGRRDSRPSTSSRSSSSSRPHQPTISDLLREGQDVLVQIAKEPIAKKGARITSHIALPGRFIVYMPTIEHLGVSRKIESASERSRLRTLIQKIKQEESVPSGGFIVRTAGVGISEEDLRQDARYLVRTWLDIKKSAEKAKSPALVHQDLDIIQRLLRDQLSDDFTAIRVDSEEEYLRTVEFVNRIQPKMVNRVKLYTREESILEAYGIQEEIDKALKPRVWLKSGGYLVINQTEALVAIDVNTGKFVGRGSNRLEDTITRTNMEAVDEIARQIRLRDLGGIIVLDLIDMEDRRNRHKVSQALQEALSSDKSPTKVLSFNDFGLIIMTRKRVKQSLERTLCTPCDYCEGAGWVKSPQTVCFEILEESRRLAKHFDDVRQTTLRVHPDVARAMREDENQILEEIEAYLGNVDITGDAAVHLEQFDFAFI
jgi:ribonuclease G